MLNPLPIVYALEMKKTSRAPYGARGLKFVVYAKHGVEVQVAPRMGRVD